jgi:hypothetical protein
MTNEMTVIDVESVRHNQENMPAMDIDMAHERWEAIKRFVGRIMTPGEDYGVIPGTSAKPVLLKAGAEKLSTFFGLSAEFSITQRIEKWDEGSEFFHYEVRCELSREGKIRGGGIGSCNSRESKYRWRSAERKCPSCGAAAIIRGKPEFGGGYLCFTKRGGCNAKYKDGDPRIEQQKTGRIPNPDICDLTNVILKMAQKRAFVAAVLNGTGASQFFTQDMEEELPTQPPPELPAPIAAKTPDPPPQPQPAPRWQRDELAAITEQMKDRASIAEALSSLRQRLGLRIGQDEAKAEYERLLGEHNVTRWEDLPTVGLARTLARQLHERGQDVNVTVE